MIQLLVKTITKAVLQAVSSKIQQVQGSIDSVMFEASSARVASQDALTLAGQASDAASAATAAVSGAVSAASAASTAAATATTAAQSAESVANAAAQAAAAAAAAAASGGIDAATRSKIDRAYSVVEVMTDENLNTIEEIASKIKADAAEVGTLRQEVNAKLDALFATSENASILTMTSEQLEAYISGLVAAEVAANSGTGA